MPVRIDASDYDRFFQRTKDASGKIRARTRKRVRDSARRYGPGIVAEGADRLPSGGGLSQHVASKGKSPTVSLTATGARLVLGKKKGPQIGRMDAGLLRHPVFWVYWRKGPSKGASRLTRLKAAVGLSPAILSDPKDRTTWKWVAQDIPGGSFTEAAEKRLPDIRDDVAREIHNVLEELG